MFGPQGKKGNSHVVDFNRKIYLWANLKLSQFFKPTIQLKNKITFF